MELRQGLLKKLGMVTAASLVLVACNDNGGQEADPTQESEENTGQTDDQAEDQNDSQDDTDNQAEADNQEDDQAEDTASDIPEDFNFSIASHTTPMVDVVELAIEELEDQGFQGELVPVNDNIQYNEAVLNDEAFASFAQHEPFMEIFNEERDGDLVAIQKIYNAIVGFYSPNYDSIDDLEEGAEVVIAGDMANTARSLFILEQHDLITLDDEEELFPSLDNIEDNPCDLQFVELEVSNTAQGYLDGYDLVFAYPTFIEQAAGLTPDDALILEEDPDNLFAISVVVREGNADTPEAEKLKEAFTSDRVTEFLDDLAEDGHLERAY